VNIYDINHLWAVMQLENDSENETKDMKVMTCFQILLSSAIASARHF
jgi:hypothetical protein